MGDLCMMQTHWRRSVENPSFELRRTKWVERVSGLIDFVGEGEVVRLPLEIPFERARRLGLPRPGENTLKLGSKALLPPNEFS